MCGIVGYVGSEFSVDYVVEGLKKLEYRGYDSAGVAVNCGSEITIRRKAGKLIELCDHLRVEPIKGRCAIGHTRWATHGAPTDVNAHPHMADDVVLVHNGIIENYRELKMQLESAGRVFTSQTDTELLAHLVAITEGETLEVRLSKALTKVRGAYALAVMSIRDPGKIVAAKNLGAYGECDHAGIRYSRSPFPYSGNHCFGGRGDGSDRGRGDRYFLFGIW